MQQVTPLKLVYDSDARDQFRTGTSRSTPPCAGPVASRNHLCFWPRLEVEAGNRRLDVCASGHSTRSLRVGPHPSKPPARNRWFRPFIGLDGRGRQSRLNLDGIAAHEASSTLLPSRVRPQRAAREDGAGEGPCAQPAGRAHGGWASPAQGVPRAGCSAVPRLTPGTKAPLRSTPRSCRRRARSSARPTTSNCIEEVGN